MTQGLRGHSPFHHLHLWLQPQDGWLLSWWQHGHQQPPVPSLNLAVENERGNYWYLHPVYQIGSIKKICSSWVQTRYRVTGQMSLHICRWDGGNVDRIRFFGGFYWETYSSHSPTKALFFLRWPKSTSSLKHRRCNSWPRGDSKVRCSSIARGWKKERTKGKIWLYIPASRQVAEGQLMERYQGLESQGASLEETQNAPASPQTNWMVRHPEKHEEPHPACQRDHSMATTWQTGNKNPSNGHLSSKDHLAGGSTSWENI